MESVPPHFPNARIESETTRILDAPQPIYLWHLTSLDAPTVALVWSLAFAWIARVHLPLWIPVLLTLTVWSVYVTDRLLDAHAALRAQNLLLLRDRHLFHWRHRRILLPLTAAAAVAAACIVFILMPPIARERNSVLAAASLAYFTRVHTGRNLPPLLPRVLSKELLVGLLFTAGCLLPALTRVTASATPLTYTLIAPLLIPAAFFALLAWLNCHAIDRWEAGLSLRPEMKIALKGTGFSPYINPPALRQSLAPEGNRPDPPSFIPSFSAASLLALAGLLLAAILLTSPRSATLLVAGSTSAFRLALLDRLRTRLTPVALRAAADFVLLTPLFLFLFAK
ncbi:MAG: hypothetical protein WA802_06750 [Terracidiphilus sp.]